MNGPGRCLDVLQTLHSFDKGAKIASIDEHILHVIATIGLVVPGRGVRQTTVSLGKRHAVLYLW
jgi:hypothetical protein